MLENVPLLQSNNEVKVHPGSMILDLITRTRPSNKITDCCIRTIHQLNHDRAHSLPCLSGIYTCLRIISHHNHQDQEHNHHYSCVIHTTSHSLSTGSEPPYTRCTVDNEMERRHVISAF